MLGQMQRTPLLLSSVLEHAAVTYGGQEIVSRTIAGDIHRTNYAALAGRARQLAHALDRLGVSQDEPVATLAWNGYRHMELYFGVTGRGGILHTVNPRLFPEQISYMINHAQDRYVFFDVTFTALLEQIAPQLPGVRGFVALATREEMPETDLPNLLCYDDLLSVEADIYTWPVLDENTASTLCYTSGTTGNPKGRAV